MKGRVVSILCPECNREWLTPAVDPQLPGHICAGLARAPESEWPERGRIAGKMAREAALRMAALEAK